MSLAGTNAIREMETHGCGRRCPRRSRRHQIAAASAAGAKGEAMTVQDGLDIQVPQPALLFDLDGTLVDSVYQHLIAWQEALATCGIELSVWRIHRRIGMSGGLFIDALSRETTHADPNSYRTKLLRPFCAGSPDDGSRHDDRHLVA